MTEALDRRDLQAENERLRALNKQNADVEARVIAGFQSRLAAAVAELRIIQRSPYSFDLDRIEAFLANQPAAPTRTEAEQAVLDAMGEVPTRTLEQTSPLDDYAGPARAELARRGLK